MFDNFDFKGFRNDIENIVKPLENKYNIKIFGGTIVKRQYEFIFSMRIEENDNFHEMVKFISMCGRYNFEPRDYGRSLVINEKEYTFIGFNEDDETNSCNIRGSFDGRSYRCTQEMVEDNLLPIKNTKKVKTDKENMEDLYSVCMDE